MRIVTILFVFYYILVTFFAVPPPVTFLILSASEVFVLDLRISAIIFL